MEEKDDKIILTFEGYDLFLKTFSSNKDSFRVEINAGMDQYKKLSSIPILPKGTYKITLELIGSQTYEGF